MLLWEGFLNYLWTWVDGFGYISSEIMNTFTFSVGGEVWSILSFLSFGGLTLYLGIAIAKWFIS